MPEYRGANDAGDQFLRNLLCKYGVGTHEVPTYKATGVNMPINRNQLEDFVKQGLVADIFKMERSYSLLKIISTNAAAINSPNTGNFGELFGSLQIALQTDAVLAAARLCDSPSKKYRTRCIRGLLDFIEAHRSELPPIRDRYNLEKDLCRIGMSQHAISLAATDEPAFALALAEHFRALLDDPQTLASLTKLKGIRNKRIAHNEQVAQLEGPTWRGLEELIKHAKDLAGVLGWAYLNTVYVINGEYALTSDAERPSRAMSRLLRKIIQTDAQSGKVKDTV